MNILVTGGAGFIGSHVVDLLLSRGHQVMVVDDFSTGKLENIRDQNGLGMINMNIEAYEHPFTLKPDVILHLAAQASITVSQIRPTHDAFVNIIGTLRMIEAARELGVQRFVLASTSAVYEELNTVLRETDVPRPATPYGVSKLAAEGYLRVMFPSSVILRLGNVYGPRQVSIGENQVVARMIDHVLCGKPFHIHGDGNQKRDFIYVGDVATAFLQAMDAEPGTYNIATGKGVSVNAVAAVLGRVLKQNIEWKHDTRHDTRREVRLAVLQAQSKLNWQAEVGLSDGLRRTVEWAKERLE